MHWKGCSLFLLPLVISVLLRQIPWCISRELTILLHIQRLVFSNRPLSGSSQQWLAVDVPVPIAIGGVEEMRWHWLHVWWRQVKGGRLSLSFQIVQVWHFESVHPLVTNDDWWSRTASPVHGIGYWGWPVEIWILKSRNLLTPLLWACRGGPASGWFGLLLHLAIYVSYRNVLEAVVAVSTSFWVTHLSQGNAPIRLTHFLKIKGQMRHCKGITGTAQMHCHGMRLNLRWCNGDLRLLARDNWLRVAWYSEIETLLQSEHRNAMPFDMVQGNMQSCVVTMLCTVKWYIAIQYPETHCNAMQFQSFIHSLESFHLVFLSINVDIIATQ